MRKASWNIPSLFDGGTLKAKEHAARVDLVQASADYCNVVITAEITRKQYKLAMSVIKSGDSRTKLLCASPAI